jgi:transketolase
MRLTFIKTLVDLAQNDPRIVLLTADLGYSAIEPFRDRFPDRFMNVGVAEQNMVGIATGLAESGFMPFVYSIVTFATLRPYEFIRNGPIVHQLPVRIIGVGGGMEYSHNGLTHFGVEDIAVMRTQPGLSVFAPADFRQTETVLRSTWNIAGPIYYRLGKDDRTAVPGLDGAFAPGKAQLIRSGEDCLVISMGGISNEAASAVSQLAASGLSCAHAVLAGINPQPDNSFISLLAQYPLIFTVEAHYLSGGLGSLVSELIAEHGLSCRLTRIGLSQTPDNVTGDQAYLYHRYGLSAQAISEKIVHSGKFVMQGVTC